jgi:hypothetical protein
MVTQETTAKQNIKIAHAYVARCAYCLSVAPNLYPIFVANFSIKGTPRNDSANIKHTEIFIKTGYSFRKTSSLNIIKPKPNNKTHINIHMFLLRTNETPAAANKNSAKKRTVTCRFNAKNTTNG